MPSEFKEQLRDSTDKNEKKDHKESFRFLKGCVLTVQEIAQKECSSSPTWLENKFPEATHHIMHAGVERTYEYFCHSVFLAE